MSEFEKDLANVMGSFIQTELDCVEKQNQEIEQLQQENKQLKKVIEEVREYIEKSSLEVNTKEFGNLTVCNSDDLLQILDKARENK